MRTIFIGLAWVLLALMPLQSAWGSQAKLRILIPVGGEDTATGFDNGTVGTSGIGITLINPISQDTRVGAGYTYFRGRLVDAPENQEQYVAVLTAHMLSLGGEYSGISLTQDFSLVLGVYVDFPISGLGTVDSASNNGPSSDATGVSGSGGFASIGITNGRWEILGYYQQTELTFHGLTVSRDSETEEVALNLQSFGIGLGYLF